MLRNRFPFFLETDIFTGNGLVRAGIPVGGISDSAFFTMEKGMKPSAIRIREVLSYLMCFFPFAPLGERKDFELRPEAEIERLGMVLGKRFKVAEGHAVQSGGKRLAGKVFFS